MSNNQDSVAAYDAEEKNYVPDAVGGNLYLTYLLIAVNVLVFILMAFDGAGIMDPNGTVHIKWGSNYGPLTLSGDPWRLVTNIFIHFGIIHLAMNMYCLFIIGSYLEPMLGKTKFITAYICTGILASLTSLWWHNESVNSAGASGAVFGLYGLFLALLTTDLIPKDARKALLQNIGIFIIYNLVYGMKGGVDNAAHIGGLISGFIFGYFFVIAIRGERKNMAVKWVLPLVLIATAGIGYAYLAQHKLPAEGREKIMAEIKAGSFKDDGRFTTLYNEFVTKQDIALKIFDDTLATPAVMIKNLKEISLPEWNKAEGIAKELQAMELGPEKQKKAAAVMEYVALRKAEIAAAILVLNGEPTGMQQLDSARTKINIITQSLK